MFSSKKHVRKYKKKPQPRREKRERFSEEDLELFEAEWAEDEAYFEEDEYEEIDDWSEEDETFEAEEYDEDDDWSEEDETFEAEEYDEENDWSEEDETFEAEEYYEEDDWSEDDETFEAEEYYEDEEGYLAENDAYRYDDDDYDFEEDEVYVSYAGNRTRNRDDVGRKRNIPPKHNRKVGGRKKGSGGVAAIAAFFTNMKGMDWAIAFSGIIILILAIVTGTLYFDFHARAQQVAAFAEVGAQMDDIEIVGESGLLAIGNAKQEQLASVMEEEIVEEEPVVEEVPEEEEDDTVQVVLKVTSIQSDLKIKFVNKSSGKLIGGAPFVAKVVGDNGKEYEWDDKDQDGIIYHTDVPNGTYKITVKELFGDWAERFTLPKEAISQKVTDQIAYKKVDVKEEIKDESQVNAAVEDTAKQDTAIESTLKDTVEWVESTKTSTGKEDSYEEVKEEDIKLPTQAKAVSSFRTMMIAPKARPLGTGIWREPDESQDNGNKITWTITISGEPSNMKVGDDPVQLSATYQHSGDTDKTPSLSWSSDGSAASVDDSGKVTPVAKGTATITVTATVDGETVGSDSVSIEIAEEEQQKPAEEIKVSLSDSVITLQVGGEGKTLTATVTGTVNQKVKWDSDKHSVATVDSNGKVTAVAKGSAKITVTTEDGGKTDSCDVNVEEPVSNIKLSLDKPDMTLEVGKEGVLKESVSGTSNTAVEWKSSDPAVASVDKGKVKALKTGKAEITVFLVSDSEIKASCKVTVNDAAKDYSNDTTKLTDKSGNQLYKKNSDGSFSEATYADFYGDYKKNGGKFYRKASKDTGYTYTGWQTIDGSTYFFDKDGNKVTGEQVIQGAKYNFDSEGRLSAGSGTMGIDVSKWNGNIDWTAVRNSGVSYVIIRCGYRGSTGGSLIEDPTYRKNIKGAKAAGLQVGVYFFTQAINEVEAVEEASMVLNLISGQGVTLPVYLDVEASGGRADGIGKDMRTQVCKAFCQTIQNSGYKAGVYANKTWFTSYINTASLTNYKIWLAQYAATPTYTATRYDMWQYSSKGSVAGISGNVDMNIRYN